MEKLNFDQMELVAGGGACSTTLWIVAGGLGALGVAFTSGAAAWGMFAYATWVSAVGTFLCYD